MTSVSRPKIRNIEPFRIPQDGQERLGLRDPQGLSDQILAIPRELTPILPLLDGTRTLAEVQQAFAQQVGTVLPLNVLEQVIQTLDGARFLENATFAEHERRAIEAFRAAGVRDAAFSGETGAYPADPGKLETFFGALFTRPRGPGMPEAPRRPGAVRGAVVPHIDFRRGGHGYAHVYRRLADCDPPDLYVVLGTNHHGSGEVYTLTRNHFETPLGRVEVDGPLTEALIEACGERLLADEFAHKKEHSIEFQAVFLRYLHDTLYDRRGQRHAFTFVPVLCGGFHRLMEAGRRPTDEEHIRKFLRVLSQAAASTDRRVCIMASADLAHIGANFGHEQPITPRLLRKMERCDRVMLDHVQRGDAEGFYDCIAAEQDRRNVCGFASIYTLLSATDARRVELLSYDQAVEQTDGKPHSVVTFAGMVLS